LREKPSSKNPIKTGQGHLPKQEEETSRLGLLLEALIQTERKGIERETRRESQGEKI